MKRRIIITALLITGLMSVANSATQETLCGAIYPENIKSVDQFILSVFKDGQLLEKHVLATSKSAKDFIAAVSVHGGRICKPALPSDSPASACIMGNLSKMTADKISCKKSKPCVGLKCS